MQSSDLEEDSDGWDEVHTEMVPDSHSRMTCLLCPHVSPDSYLFFDHLLRHEKWGDLLSAQKRFISNQYDWIRFVNLVRRNQIKDWHSVFLSPDWKLKSDESLRPALQDDAVLSIDIESVLEEYDLKHSGDHYSPPVCGVSNGPLSDIKRLMEENTLLREQLVACRKFISDTLKQAPPDAFSDSDMSESYLSPTHHHAAASNYSILSAPSSSYRDKLNIGRNASAVTESLEFSTYRLLDVQRLSLRDHVWVDFCRGFFTSNMEAYFLDKIVLDTRCASGFLSLLAAEAGAAHVYSVEPTTDLYAAAFETMRANNIDDRVTLIHDQQGSFTLPVNQVDVILHMELNHFMSFESVLSAARRYLHPETGRIFPRHYRMHLLGIHSGKSLRHTHCDVWADYKMSALHRASLCKVHLMDVSAALGSDATDSCHILTSTPCVLYDLDLLQLTRSKSDHSTAFPSLREYPFSFTVDTSSKSQARVVLDAIVAYFDVRFDDDARTPSSFSTSPSSAQTHWKHAVLFLNTPIQVEHGDLVTGTVSVHRRADPKCSLDLQLCVNALRDQPALRQRYSFECQRICPPWTKQSHFIHSAWKYIVYLENDFSAFREPQFDNKRWINETLKSAIVEHNVQEKATDLVLQLQGQMKEVMQTLDRTRQDILITVPRVLREVEALKSDALTLGSELEQLKASLSEVNAGGQQTITRLVELDRERRNAQAAANALQETVRWSNLVNGIDELLEAGELDQVCCSLEGMEQCLTALNLLSDYSERMTLLERHKNSLEALIAPQIIHALDHTTADACSRLDDTGHVDREAKHLINLLHRIGREAAAKNYYTNWLKLQLKSYWEKSNQPQQASIGPALHRFVEKMLAFGSSEPPDHTFLSGDASSQCTQSLSPILLTFYASMIQLFEHQVQCHLFGASHPMVLMKVFTDAVESLHSTRITFVLGSTVDSADSGGTRRAEQISSLLKISLRCCSLLGDILSSQFPNMDAPAYHDVCGQLVHAILSPFGAIVDTFGRQLRKRFEDELSRIQLNTAEQHHFLDGLAQTISSSIQLIHTSIQSCFDLTLGMGLPHLLSSIQFYWVTLLAKWTIAIDRSVEHLINTDAKGGHSQTTGFVCALRVATLTGELSLKADTFVENLMDKSADFLSKVFTPSDSSPLLGIGIFSTSLYTEDWNSICSSDWALLNQLALSLPSDCLDALQSIAHPSDRIEQLDGSTIPRLQTSLSSLHRTNVTACRAAVLMLRRVALAPIRQFLQPVPSLPVWSTKPDSGDDTLPDLAYLPQDYITRVGQYLLVLFDHLEPYMCNGNDPELSAPRDSSDFTPSQALTECLHLGNLEAASIPARVASTGHSEAEAHTSNLRRRLVSLTHDSRRCTEIHGGLPVFRWFESFVSGTACDLLATNMLRIGDAAVARAESRLSRGQRGDDTEDESELRRHELLTSHGAKQLEVDLGYLQHLLDDLGLSFPGHLQALRELISCPADRFASLSASRPPSIVNAIARLRGL